MESIDLTVIFITANLVPEAWAEYQMEVLQKAIGDYPLITISRKPMNIGLNILDKETKGISNIYKQILRAAKAAKTTYVAVAEDDALYTRDHFTFFRPPHNAVAYNWNRWTLFTWGTPTFSLKERISNCSLIAPREYLIDALEERFEKYPHGTPEGFTGEVGKARVERHLKISTRKRLDVYSTEPIVHFNHDFATENAQRSHRKKMGMIRAYEIPYWGRADELVKKFV